MSPRSCCILTVSSSIAQGKKLVERIIASSRAPTNSTTFAETEIGTTLELPWTISNKYYTAPVHFSIIETPKLRGECAVDVPACIFVFSIAEPFREDFNTLMSHFEGSDFEVSIAVSVPAIDVCQLSDDEQDDLETYFSEHGFEYVNGQSDPDTSHERDIEDREGIPGIGRLVDALSTILWPSMIQDASSRRVKARSVVSVPGPPDEEDGLRALLNADKDTSTNAIRQQEIAALEQWLEEGADDGKDPWEGHVFEPRPEVNSKIDGSLGFAPGFDDNFSDFVSVPAHADAGTADTHDDPVLPSQAEIKLTSERIFSMASAHEMDEGDSQTPFDLSRVLGALEAMKEEIAAITDEDEKRKAAAKVALGLVYGLEEG